MATTTAVFTPARISGAVISIGSKATQKSVNKVVYIRGLNSYGGLKANNGVVSLGMPVCTEQCFANFVSSIKASAASNGNGKSGGALSAKCNKIAEIFTIAASMNGIVLVGVALGFVLLRMESFFEETESD
ncbi:uncharacterized protein LOC126682367 [Mercurialis annua]|uniref:uncharacterized protein LOC126682367 n=1 Tax=Mercurialis annua TaxID=3986 RepID=UPI00216048A5|nr:uncharacterized protein LOC126682367 [Mercurialis annua]